MPLNGLTQIKNFGEPCWLKTVSAFAIVYACHQWPSDGAWMLMMRLYQRSAAHFGEMPVIFDLT
jgi:hypothetical protein